MTAHAAIAAVPKSGTPKRTLLQAMLVSRFAWVVGSGEDPQDFDPRGEDGAPLTRVIGYNGLWFWYDEADSTTGHDGTTCIVTTATGGRYKVTGVELLITSVISKTVTTPPDPDDVDPEARPSNGDSYLVPAAASGAWATKEDYIAVWVESRREWFYIAPKAGWYLSVPGVTRDTVYRYDSVQSAWITGDGSTPGVDTVPISAIIGIGASLTVRVQNQTTYAPPGSRVTGGTPAMALGGTASNINDNSDSTTATTSALGNLTGASVASRIVAKVSFAAAKDLISIEVRGVLGSAASSSNAMGIYYSADSGASWTQAGSGFTLSTSAQNIQRNGTFAGVTDIALVTEGKNWGANTNTVAGVNGFTADVSASVGDALIIGAPAIGIFAGLENKVAICEASDTFTIYTQQDGDQVYDISLGKMVRWSSAQSAWVLSQGVVNFASVVTQGTDTTTVNDSGPLSPTYVYSDTVWAGTSTGGFRRGRVDDAGIFGYAAQAAGNVLEFEYDAWITGWTFGATTTTDSVSADQPAALALYRDNETSPVAWTRLNDPIAGTPGTFNDPHLARGRFIITAGDTAAHDYRIVHYSAWGNGTGAGAGDQARFPTAISHRIFTLTERG